MACAVTVTGKVETGMLGFCQMHEHLYVSEGPATRMNPDLLIDSADLSAAEALRYRASGGGTIVDCQPGGAGRNASVLYEISRKTGIHIITVTGFHLPVFYEPGDAVLTAGEDTLYGLFSGELAEGCREAPEVKPGAVKAAIGKDGCTGQTETCYRAAARAAAEAEVPLIVHTEKGYDAVKAVDLALQAGAKIRQILICHADRQADNYSVHEEIAATGAMMEYDTIGRFKYHDDASEIRLIRHMIDRGYLKQLLLSLDTTNRRMTSYGGGIGLDYLQKTFLPSLSAEGITEEEIRQITINNPASVF